MADSNSNDDLSGIEQMLRQLLGDEAAERMLEQMRQSGLDPQAITGGMNLPKDPTQIQHLIQSVTQLFSGSSEALDWDMVSQIAIQTSSTKPDPAPTAAQAARARDALSIADLWLDSVTVLTPGRANRHAWSRAEWIRQTLPTWKVMCMPVATHAADAMTDALSQQLGRMGLDQAEGSFAIPGLGISGALGKMNPADMVRRMSGSVFAMQIGQAIGTLAGQALGSTDVGLPLSDDSLTALVVSNVDDFGTDLGIGADDVLQYLAVREAASARLYNAAPWLRSYLLRAISKYSAQIQIDFDHIEQTVRDLDSMDPAHIQEAMSSGMFSPTSSEAQEQAKKEVETILAVVEGWVEEVTAKACSAYLPAAAPLQEMMRRRRSQGGPAEQVLAQLMGLELRPKRVRDAAKLWRVLGEKVGQAERDKYWSHPDVMPTAEELDNPDSFLEGRQKAAEADAQVDAELEALLDGTLGYAKGLDAGDESAGQQQIEESQDEDSADSGDSDEPHE
ncbi:MULTISPECIES: zinc-dependent metalloprotease [Winkia]|uniref:Zinc-dependent metalloprotease n=2 Tax=Winkia neuii TaxID=33007 RepID=A0AB38XMK3_9ACTO|nr:MULTISPECIES: zinc-dependent metalloprotease [Winkia]PLB79713.1 hydrolase [Actinomyces sp. UMB0138]MBS5947994.1 zinc-dependent metalloprotease [Winkia neuii]MDK7163924.1 zinc-dependent metalloprotease [Winkia sp. UMB3105]MDK8595070.1 zinc-dependent metalloprotease [Winkia sp. UMB1096A]MDU2269969.1 zinc-dependent metalloprotease [Winkia neuii]